MDVRNAWELSESKAREWESEFLRIPKDEETSEIADEMKSHKKSLEAKDEIEEKMRTCWQELKAAARELPCGRMERSRFRTGNAASHGH